MSSVIGTCTFNPSDYKRFPFSYLDDNGDQMASNATGLSVSVPGYGEPVCVFNTSRCLADVTQGTSGPGCCNNRQDDPPFWIPIAIQVLIFNLPWVGQAVWGWLKRVMPAKRGENVTDKPEGGDLFGQALMKSKGDREPDGAWMCGFLLVIMLGIAASICKIAIMPAEVQHTMQPTERAAQMAIGAFINPVREIFAFLEDSMATRVAYAMAAGRKHELNVLMHIGILGGLLAGLLAFGCMAIIAFSSAAEAILNPSAASTSAIRAAGCELVSDPTTLLDDARTYWLLATSVWIGGFMRRSIDGFMLGAGYLIIYFFPMVVTGLVPVVVWFVGKPHISPSFSSLTLLGLAEGLDDWINALFLLGFILTSTSLQTTNGLRLLLPWRKKADGSDEPESPFGTRAELMTVLKESAELMLVDLAVQVSLAITIYIAADESFTLAYKLSAPEAAYAILGPSNFLGLLIMFRSIGAVLVAKGSHREYVALYLMMLILAAAQGLYAIGMGSFANSDFAASYGKSACIYASQVECAQAYADIFYSPGAGPSASADNLSGVFLAIGPVTAMRMLFLALRAGLNTCHDFHFLSIGAVATFVFAYVPAILIVRFACPSALGYFLAANVVPIVGTVVYGWRMRAHLSALIQGLPGPWSEHMNKLEVARESSLRRSSAAAHAGPSVGLETEQHKTTGKDVTPGTALLPTAEVVSDAI